MITLFLIFLYSAFVVSSRADDEAEAEAQKKSKGEE